jgi:hypothetical protein
MSGSYPSFKRSYSQEELIEHFLLTPADVHLVVSCRGDTNRCGMALLLKTLDYLGYVPESLAQIPVEVRSFVAGNSGCCGTSRITMDRTVVRGANILPSFVSTRAGGILKKLGRENRAGGG